MKDEIVIKNKKDLNYRIDEVLNNIYERKPVLLREHTPQILINLGVKDLPMYENPSHIRKNILTINEAKKIGLKIRYNDHYHGLGKDIFLKVLDSLDSPRVIFKCKNKNDYIILTNIKDLNKDNIIVPIEINSKTRMDNLSLTINRIKTIYGYDKNIKDLNLYIKSNIKNNNFSKIYEQKKEQGVRFTNTASS